MGSPKVLTGSDGHHNQSDTHKMPRMYSGATEYRDTLAMQRPWRMNSAVNKHVMGWADDWTRHSSHACPDNRPPPLSRQGMNGITGGFRT